MDICIDFDGTCVTHEFPKVGVEIGAVPILKELVANGHRLILFTMRSNVEHPQSEAPEINCSPGNYLDDAIAWFEKHEIPLYGIQSNPTQKRWTTSPKAYGQLYIDDAALGCPLIQPHRPDEGKQERPYVDWCGVRLMLLQKGIIH